jgi:hypothetical protein
MNELFENRSCFNEDISLWDVGLVTNMYCMFPGTTSFNQDIGGWDVCAVTNMGFMFYGAAAGT